MEDENEMLCVCAVVAMHALLTSNPRGIANKSDAQYVAKCSFNMADAMIQEFQKHQSNPKPLS